MFNKGELFTQTFTFVRGITQLRKSYVPPLQVRSHIFLRITQPNTTQPNLTQPSLI